MWKVLECRQAKMKIKYRSVRSVWKLNAQLSTAIIYYSGMLLWNKPYMIWILEKCAPKILHHTITTTADSDADAPCNKWQYVAAHLFVACRINRHAFVLIMIRTITAHALHMVGYTSYGFDHAINSSVYKYIENELFYSYFSI